MNRPRHAILFSLLLGGLPMAYADVSAEATPKEPTQYVILGGKRVPTEEARKQYENARKTTAFDVNMKVAVPAKKLGATYVEGKVASRSGAKVMLMVNDKPIMVILRNMNCIPAEGTVGLMLVERSATTLARPPGGENVSMKQYTDVTVLMEDFIRTSNAPLSLKADRPTVGAGKGLSKKNTLSVRKSGFERRETKVNRR